MHQKLHFTIHLMLRFVQSPRLLVSCVALLFLPCLAAIRVYEGTFIPASRLAKPRVLLQDD
jgi:hypothetical protein